MTTSGGPASSPIPAAIVPNLLDILVPGDDIVIDLFGEPWRCRLVRHEPELCLLTKLAHWDQATTSEDCA